jgi:hypothetical protein
LDRALHRIGQRTFFSFSEGLSLAAGANLACQGISTCSQAVALEVPVLFAFDHLHVLFREVTSELSVELT